MLVEQAARKAAGPGHGDEGGGEEEGGWRREWEETVNRLVEQSEGWRCASPVLLPDECD